MSSLIQFALPKYIIIIIIIIIIIMYTHTHKNLPLVATSFKYDNIPKCTMIKSRSINLPLRILKLVQQFRTSLKRDTIIDNSHIYECVQNLRSLKLNNIIVLMPQIGTNTPNFNLLDEPKPLN